MITFAIPTWNRADKLKYAVHSIADQHVEGMQILILDHGSDDHTPQVLEELMTEYPFITVAHLARGDKPDYSDAFKFLFTLPQTEWTWTFGDDDELLPKAVEQILPALQRNEFEFIHVAEKKRSSQTGKLIKGRLADLCNNYGLLDMTGFITGNIVKTSKLKEAAYLPSWPIYARSAFAQSLALYEVLRNDKSAFLDYAMVDSQDEEQDDETKARWTKFDIPTRYFHLIDGLMDMKARNILTECDPPFFRYLSYFLWDRFCQNIISSFTTTQEFVMTDMLYELFDRTLGLCDFLKEVNRKRYRDEILEVREALENYAYGIKATMEAQQRVDRVNGAHSVERFPWNYIKGE